MDGVTDSNLGQDGWMELTDQESLVKMDGVNLLRVSSQDGWS